MRQGSSSSGRLSWQRQRQGMARGDRGVPIAASWVRASLPGPEPPRQQTLYRERANSALSVNQSSGRGLQPDPGHLPALVPHRVPSPAL